jgi:hypothetical protein
MLVLGPQGVSVWKVGVQYAKFLLVMKSRTALGFNEDYLAKANH